MATMRAGLSLRNPHQQLPGLWRLSGVTEATQQIHNDNRNVVTRIRNVTFVHVISMLMCYTISMLSFNAKQRKHL